MTINRDHPPIEPASFVESETATQAISMSRMAFNPTDLLREILKYETVDAVDVESLIKTGADLGGSTIFLASDHEEVVLRLIKLGAILNGRDLYQQTALHRAAARGHLKVVNILCEQKVDVSARDRDGHTPLHFACVSGHLETVMALVGWGADVNACGDTTPLHEAVYHGSLSITKYLLQHGAYPNARSRDLGWTPLHFAAFTQNLEIVRCLLQAGVIVDVTDGRTMTPLDHIVVQRQAGEPAEQIEGWLRTPHTPGFLYEWRTARDFSTICDLNIQWVEGRRNMTPWWYGAFMGVEKNLIQRITRLNQYGLLTDNFQAGMQPTIHISKGAHDKGIIEMRSRPLISAYFLSTNQAHLRLMGELREKNLMVLMAHVKPFRIVSGSSSKVVYTEERRARPWEHLGNQEWQPSEGLELNSLKDTVEEMCNEFFKNSKPMQSNNLYFFLVTTVKWSVDVVPLADLVTIAAERAGFGLELPSGHG